MDAREKRGLALAQEGRVKHVEGPLWVVRSDKAGGHLVNVETGSCSCPDHARERMKCKHIYAVESARAAPIPAADAQIAPVAPQKRAGRRMKGDLTVTEIANTRAALRFLVTRSGGWARLIEAIGGRGLNYQRMARSKAPTAGLAIRLARLARVPVDDVLCGRFPPPGSCPHCGHIQPASV